MQANDSFNELMGNLGIGKEDIAVHSRKADGTIVIEPVLDGNTNKSGLKVIKDEELTEEAFKEETFEEQLADFKQMNDELKAKMKAQKEAEKQKQMEEENKRNSKFSDDDKESVLISFMTGQPYQKSSNVKLGKKATLSVEFKTISEEDQMQLNQELNLININGQLRENTVKELYGREEKFQVIYHADQGRATRQKMLTYHLHRIGTEVFATRKQAEEKLFKSDARFNNMLFEKGLTPFLQLVNEACDEADFS